MRKFAILSAVAPLALLAACGDNDAEDTEMDTDTMAADTAANDTAMAGSNADMEAGPAMRLADAGDYSGTYSYDAGDGNTRSVRLNSADTTYEYMGDDGEPMTGRYTMADDGYRLQIRDFYGTPAWFTVSNGQLVRLQGDTEITADNSMTVTGERYMRSESSDDVFSREPELGSSVAPPQN